MSNECHGLAALSLDPIGSFSPPNLPDFHCDGTYLFLFPYKGKYTVALQNNPNITRNLFKGQYRQKNYFPCLLQGLESN